MKSRYVSLRKNPAGSPENKKISYPGKGTRFGKHLFFTCLKIEYTLCEHGLSDRVLPDSSLSCIPCNTEYLAYGMTQVRFWHLCF